MLNKYGDVYVAGLQVKGELEYLDIHFTSHPWALGPGPDQESHEHAAPDD